MKLSYKIITILFVCLQFSSIVYSEKIEKIGFDLFSIEANGVRQSTARVSMNKSLAPFKDHLLQFPFHNYKIRYLTQISLPVKTSEKFYLSDNEVLQLKVLYCEDKRASIWINWQDSEGNEVLDTRLHFNKDEPIIAGVEEGEFKGKFLLLKLKN